MYRSAIVEPFSNTNRCESLVELLQARALENPDKTAYQFLKNGEEISDQFTYGQLDLRAKAVAAHLQQRDLAGERALLLLPSGLEFIAAFFGCLYAGVVAVPGYPPRNARSLPRIRAIVDDAKASAVLSTSTIAEKTEKLFARESTPLAIDTICLDTVTDACANDWRSPHIDEETLAFLQYTSGSTGAPKGVMVRHRNILSNLEMIHAGLGITDEDIGLSWLPLFHDMGLIGHVLAPVYAGVPSILMSPSAFLQKPSRWLEAISQHKATISGGPNFAYALCHRKIGTEQKASIDLSHWRVAYNGAEPVKKSAIDDFSGSFAECGFNESAFLPTYGLAEATLMVSAGPAEASHSVLGVDRDQLEKRSLVARTLADDTRVQHLVACGEFENYPGQQVVIVDPKTRTLCTKAEIGEIWVAGPHIAGGYWGREEETQSTFNAYLTDDKRGPFLRTGDLGVIRNNQLFVTGRIKDLILIRGRNIYPQDIEYSVQQSHPALALHAGAAFSVEVEDEERLVVVQELPHRQKLDVEALVGQIRQTIVDQHLLQPHAIVLIKAGSLPKTSSGKIQRQATREQYFGGSLHTLHVSTSTRGLTSNQDAVDRTTDGKHQTRIPVISVQPERSAEAIDKAAVRDWLVTQLATELQVPTSEIDIHQPFTYYGLASVEGAELGGKLESWLGQPVPLSLIWEYPTIDAVSEHLVQR